MEQRRRLGFTLVELLVVMTILAILFSMLTPAIVKTRDKAHQYLCSSKQKQIGMALQMYSQDYDEMLPGFLALDAQGHLFTLWDTLEPYHHDFKLFTCPTGRGYFYDGEQPHWLEAFAAMSGFQPNLDNRTGAKDRVSSFAVNRTMFGGGCRNPFLTFLTQPLSAYPYPAAQVTLYEGLAAPLYNYRWAGARNPISLPQQAVGWHDDWLNVTFLDGHLRSVKLLKNPRPELTMFPGYLGPLDTYRIEKGPFRLPANSIDPFPIPNWEFNGIVQDPDCVSGATPVPCTLVPDC